MRTNYGRPTDFWSTVQDVILFLYFVPIIFIYYFFILVPMRWKDTIDFSVSVTVTQIIVNYVFREDNSACTTHIYWPLSLADKIASCTRVHYILYMYFLNLYYLFKVYYQKLNRIILLASWHLYANWQNTNLHFKLFTISLKLNRKQMPLVLNTITKNFCCESLDAQQKQLLDCCPSSY